MRLLLHTAIFVALAPGAMFVGAPALIVWVTGAEVAAAAAIAAGLAIFVWCVGDFIVRGRGTPDPAHAPTELVVHGLFGVIRNPMYVGGVTIIAGEAILFLSPWLAGWAIVALAAFHARVIVYEEPTLARTFGPSWESYRARVPRWLPRLRA